MNKNAAEIKRAVSISKVLAHYGSTQDSHGRWRCLFSGNHHNGDCHHSVDTKNGFAKCWSQGCFGERGVDVFSFVGLMEGLTNFAEQKRRVCEIGGLTENGVTQARKIIRCYRWEDTEGRVAWHLRWEPGNPKFTWSQDEHGKQSGLGQCKPTLRHLDGVSLASRVIIVAGERDQETVNELLKDAGLFPDTFATTTAYGESDVKTAYLQPLFDKPVVFLSGDNDEAGQAYIQKYGQILQGKVEDLRILKVPEGWNDWTDWQAQGATAEEFKALLDQAQPATLLPHHNTQSFTLTSMKDFLNEPDDHVVWLVKDMLPKGGLSVIGGKPKAGKSTTARNLAIAVARGEPFLGFPTTQGPVIYCAFEEKRGEVKRHFQQLGATEDLPIFIFVGSAPDDMVQQIEKVAAEKKPALIILDTLIKVAKVKDLNDYAQVMKALDPFLRIARESGSHLLLVHHAGKSDRDGGDALLGSTAIFGTVDTCMIQKRSEKYRTLQTIQRYGTDLEETVLEWDTERKAISLGGSKKDTEVKRLEDEILTFVNRQPDGVSREILEESTEGRTGPKREALKNLVQSKAIVRQGEGKKNNPFTYYPKDSCFVVPHICREQGNKKAQNDETPRQQRADSCSQASIDFEETSKPQEQENEAVLVEKNGLYEEVADAS